ncbi:nucleoside/nucleotide kinase family protein [Marisediminicola senii]|uniref:nucleoside/nucleotide kinase family protein n=1 Tax=Marisediminicola senii TaxID=2711233 RepID=UPI0013EDA245|nr:nucleoside/nucleotide kinase family protein [Marisediminicola senii]
MPSLVATLPDLVARARALAVPGRRHILGITGKPGSGKSTLAQHIVDELGPGVAAIVPMDGFHLANTVLHRLGRRDRKGAPDTFDAGGFADLLQRIRDDPARHDPAAPLYAPEFRRDLDESVGSALEIARSTPLIVTEGNYLLLGSDPDDLTPGTSEWRRARSAIDSVWFVDLDDAERTERLIRRHEGFGMPRADAERWTRGPDERNATLVAATAAGADLVVTIA